MRNNVNKVKYNNVISNIYYLTIYASAQELVIPVKENVSLNNSILINLKIDLKKKMVYHIMMVIIIKITE